MRKRVRVGPVLVALAVAVALVGGAVGIAGTRAQPVELNVYSSRHYDTDQRLYDDFTAQTGIKLNLVEGGDDQIIERLRAEGRNSPADILITVDAGRLWRAAEAGLFQSVQSPVLESRIPANLREPSGLWFGFSTRARVIMYARDRVEAAQAPQTYEALADPVWRGRVLVRSSSNVYNQSLVGSMIESRGAEATEAWARGLVANFARPPQGGDTDQIKAVAAGEGDVALSNTYYLARLVASDKADERAIAERIGVVFPNQGEGDRGTHVNLSGAGVLANARNPEAAVRFLEYLTSESAQRYFALGNHEYPVVEGVELDPVLAAWGSFRRDDLNAARFGANNPLALQIMDRAGWK